LDDFVVLSRSGGVGTITLNRPTLGVLWSGSLARQLILALSAVEFDDTLDATVLTVAGSPSRLTRIVDDPHSEGRKAAVHQEWDDLFETMCRLKKPRVAAINSIAAGSAFQVALLCDVRIAHARALMGRPGWVPAPRGLNGAVVEPDHFTKIAANGHILSGNLISAERCLELGLINQIVPEEDLMTEAFMLAQNFAAVPRGLYNLPKRRLWEMSSQGFRARIELSKRVYKDAYMAASPAKALERLLERRGTRTM
jgi:enoyl-CoA hydratase